MFEMAEEDVLGTRMPVFKQRVPSLRTFVERSAGFGDAEYAIFGDRRLTFAQNERAVASVAKALREKYGVAKGDRVAILAANCPECPPLVAQKPAETTPCPSTPAPVPRTAV